MPGQSKVNKCLLLWSLLYPGWASLEDISRTKAQGQCTHLGPSLWPIYWPHPSVTRHLLLEIGSPCFGVIPPLNTHCQSLLSCFLLHSLRHQDGSESRDDCQGQAPTGLVTWFSGHYRPIPCNQFRSAIPLPYCIFLLFLYPISWPLLPSPQLCSHLRSASTPWSGAVSRSRAGHQLSPGLWGWSGALLPRSLWGRFQVGRSHPKSASRSRMFIPPGRAYRAWFQGHFSGGSNEVRCRIIQPVWHKSNHLLDLVAGLLLSLLEGWLAEYFEELFAAVIGWFVAGLA